MIFEPADIFTAFKSKSEAEYGTSDDGCEEVILGSKFNEAVREKANGYIGRLELDHEWATDTRAKLLDLHWGKIEQDAALLEGLGEAIRTMSASLANGVSELSGYWKGESFDAFSTAMTSLQATLDEYANGATATGEGFRAAMAEARNLYQGYSEECVNDHLNFGKVSLPEDWHKMTDTGEYSGFKLAEICEDIHSHSAPPFDLNYNCNKNDDEPRNVLTGNFVTQRQWDNQKLRWCDEEDEVVLGMYREMVEKCSAARTRIDRQIKEFGGATKEVVDSVTEMYELAMENLNTFAKADVFSSLRIVSEGGGQPAGGGSGDVSGGGSSDGGGGGSYGGGGAGAYSPPPMETPPAGATDPAAMLGDPSAALPGEDALGADAAARQTVEIKDGDRTITMTSPDAEGHVTVTIDDGTGEPKTYELDFGGASADPAEAGALTGDPVAAATPGADAGAGSDPLAGAAGGGAAEQVVAGADGKAVIHDGSTNITTEQVPGEPGKYVMAVADESGETTTYTVDYSDPANPTTADGPGAGAAMPGAVPGQNQTAQQSASGHSSTGEAGLASAPDETSRSAAGGAGMPMLGGMGAGGAGESGDVARGGGWAVHGDLFDSSSPAAGFHGVLGDDDRESHYSE